MSQENVEMVRVAYEVAYVKRSVDDVRDRFAEDFVFHSRKEWPGKAVYGMDEMPGLWADLDDTYSEFELAPAQFEAIGQNYVLVEVAQSACLRGSDARVETTLWHLWRVERLPREAWTFGKRSEALEAAGLSE